MTLTTETVDRQRVNGRQALPRFVTFTGADEETPIEEMATLSKQYPIEWGILFSPKQQGQGRYPPMRFVREVTQREGLRLSAHLCGGHSKDVIALGACSVPMEGFRRAQINSSDTSIDVTRVSRWARDRGVAPILQCRESFPMATETAWLFDKSGGQGISPDAWPQAHPAAACGYAGGIKPENVKEVLGLIAATDYWIDMESGVRDANDRFSLAKCRAVCEAVYGP